MKRSMARSAGRRRAVRPGAVWPSVSRPRVHAARLRDRRAPARGWARRRARGHADAACRRSRDSRSRRLRGAPAVAIPSTAQRPVCSVPDSSSDAGRRAPTLNRRTSPPSDEVGRLRLLQHDLRDAEQDGHHRHTGAEAHRQHGAPHRMGAVSERNARRLITDWPRSRCGRRAWSARAARAPPAHGRA